MKKLLYIFLPVLLMLSGRLSAGAVEPRKVNWEQLGDWKEGYFEIHAIATGKGEALLFVFPDGTTMLVDAGDTTDNGWVSDPFPDASKAPGQWVAEYIRNYLHTDHIDYFLLSHFHGDHSGSVTSFRPGHDGYKLSGITDVAEEISIGTIIDRGYPDYDYPSAAFVQKEPTLNYIKFVRHMVGTQGQHAEGFKVGSHSQVRMLHNPSAYKDFDVWNLAANCKVATGRGRKVHPMYEPGDDPEKFDENMFSICQLMTYGDFTFFTGGDLPGGYWVPEKPTPHERVYDAQVARLIGHPVTMLKACHHGTRDSSSPEFLWRMRPEVVLFMSSGKGHPSEPTIRRMLDPLMPGSKQLYSTSYAPAERLGDLWDSFKGWGHIIIRVAPGGKSYEIFLVDPREGYSTPQL